MRTAILLTTLIIIAAGCGRSAARPAPGPAPARSVGVGEDAGARDTRDGRGSARASARTPARGPRHLNGVPPGHYPKPGECRLWVPGRPPGQQAPSTSCRNLRGTVPAGAFVLYGGTAWDADYDWVAEARRDQSSVPEIILDVLRGRR